MLDFKLSLTSKLRKKHLQFAFLLHYALIIEQKSMGITTTLDTWITIKIAHDYFLTDKNYINLEPESNTNLILQRLGILIKKEDNCNWKLLKKADGEMEYDPKLLETLKFNLKINDPDFFYYTNPEVIVDNEILQIKNSDKKGIWKQLEIHTKSASLKKEHFINVNIKSISKFFEFIIIPKPDSENQVMKLTEDKNALIFNPDEIDLFYSDQKSVYRFVSSEKIYLRESYNYKISLWDVSQKAKKILFDAIPFPNSSAISVLNSDDTISSYIYF